MVLVNDLNNFRSLENLENIDLIEAYENNIKSLFLSVNGDYLGFYDLENITESAAIGNYNKILDKLLKDNYFCLSELKNFIFY